MQFSNFQEVYDYLDGMISKYSSNRGAYTLERMRQLMDSLGNPQNDYKTIHLAGTSGKSSTSYFLSAFLRQSDVKVGLSVSPHVDNINERVQINGRPISEKKFCQEFSRFVRLVEKSGIKPTYFEMLAAFAMWEFKKAKVEYAVIEVGMGGLLDGTNVFRRRDKVCVITDIGLDHTETLGETLQRITVQKAGIIQPHNTVFTYDQDDEIMDVIREVCQQQQAELHEIWPLKASELPKSLPLFQRRNWYLAWSAFSWLQERDGLRDLTESELAETADTYIPARMERLKYKGKTLILDGSHNAQKLDALVRSVSKMYPKQPVAVMAGFLQTKRSGLRDSLSRLLPLANHLVLTNFIAPGAVKESIEPAKIVEHCAVLKFENWEIAETPKAALEILSRRNEQVLLVTGSFYLLNHIRPLIIKAND